VLLRSKSESAAGFSPTRAKNQIARDGTPISWAYIGLKSGGYSIYPGHPGVPEAFDVRKRPWYESTTSRSKNDRGPQWGDPTMDVHGQGQVLSCVQPIFDEDENFLGVAGIDVTYDYMLDELLPMEGVSGVEQVLLLDENGREVVNSKRRLDKSSYEVGNLRNRTIRMPEFDVDEVRAAIKSRRTGYVESMKDGENRLILYILMNSTNWYYVVVADKDTLLWNSALTGH